MNIFLTLGISALALFLVVLISAAASAPGMSRISTDIETTTKEPSP